MKPSSANAKLVIEGNADLPQYKETLALLDQSGLSFRIGLGAAPGIDDATRLRWGDETLSDVSRDKVVAFLWAHGARFEDS